MAAVKNVYFYDEVYENLKHEENVSKLINQLLRDYFKTKEIKTLTLDEISNRLKILDIQEEAIQKVKEIENGAIGQQGTGN